MSLLDVIDPKKKAQMKASEKVIIKRLLDKKMKYDNKSAKDVILAAAKRTGMDPDFLAANAMQEGMNKAIISENRNVISGDFPVDGFLYYGLDTFGDAAPRLAEKGYIPRDFSYGDLDAENEKGTPVRSASFRTNEDALVAKAAYLRDFRDQVDQYAGKKNVKLEKGMRDYLTMSAYNGGMGNAKIMVDELATGKFNQKDYIDKGMTSRKGIHKNISPRMEKMSWLNEMIMPAVQQGPRQAAMFPASPTAMMDILKTY
jgi:hypothetical protein